MEAVDYLRAIARSWWIVLIALVAGGLGGFFVYEQQTPVYQASVRLVVTLNAPNLDPVSAASVAGARATSLSQVATTNPAIADAAKAAGFPGAAPSVAASAGATQPFVQVTVTSASAKLAAAVANAYVKTLPESTVRLTGQASTSYKLQQLAPAGVPGSPIEPVLTKDVGFGIIGGLIIGLALAIVRDVLNRSVRSSDELRKVTGLTVLGTVPRDMPKVLLPTVTEPRSARAEAYRQIRTTLLSARRDDAAMKLAFTSAVLGEGKTSVATNVAAAFARAGHRVVIVDADLRRPRVGAFFDREDARGLSDVLAGRATLDEVLIPLQEGRLNILTSGPIPADPSEALGSENFDKLLQELERRFEYILIDTPPVLPVTDALVVSPKVDGLVLVVRLNFTSRTRVEHALAALERIDANVFGVVPNQAGRGTDSDYRYPYRYAAGKKSKQRDGSAAMDEPIGLSATSAPQSGEPVVPPAAEPVAGETEGHRPAPNPRH